MPVEKHDKHEYNAAVATQSGTIMVQFVGVRTKRQKEVAAGFCELFLVAMKDRADVSVETTNDKGIVSISICAKQGDNYAK